eukprot:Skav212280  [mRNA]  locus=scaffold732:336097:359067:- [translate_table: standard]
MLRQISETPDVILLELEALKTERRPEHGQGVASAGEASSYTELLSQTRNAQVPPAILPFRLRLDRVDMAPRGDIAEILPSDEHPAARRALESDAFLGCGYCNEAFAEKRELEVHIRMQHPGKEYVCVPAPMPKREQGLLQKAPSMAISRNIPLSEVNRHCIPEDCWVALNGKVYDLSEFMDRHPGLEITAGKELPFFSRAEVAKHNTAEESWLTMVLKYDELYKAGTDATQDFEVFEHSEKARVQRDRDMLVGQLLPAEAADWSAEATSGPVLAKERRRWLESSESSRYLRYKAYDVVLGAIAWYLYKTLQNRKPLSQFTYSRALRHLHLLMAVGIFGAVGTAQAASHCEGQSKKQLLWWHKQSLGKIGVLGLGIGFILLRYLSPWDVIVLLPLGVGGPTQLNQFWDRAELPFPVSKPENFRG